MLMFGGIAVDLMINEKNRVHLQNATDRAVLAAANLDQTVDAKVVVQDYLAKSGIKVDADRITVSESNSGDVTARSVAVNVDASHSTLFMNLSGVDSLPFRANSEAAESVDDIEISLILDISGSMGKGTKLPDLQKAAKKFVSKVLDNPDNGRVSLSLVPYSTQVAAGQPLLDAMNVSQRHTYSSCVNFPESDFKVPRINHGLALKQTAHFDPWKSYDSTLGGSERAPYWRVCRDDAGAEVLAWTDSASAINAQIDAMTAGGNTSIDVAVKWGLALLDPSMQGQLDALIADSRVTTTPAEFSGRPFAYNRDDMKKYIIVMTDGINTTQYYYNDAYKTGDSDVWIDTATGRLSRKSGKKYFWAHDRSWESTPYDSDGSGSGSTARRMTWPEVWNEMTLKYWAYELYYLDDYNAQDYYDAIDAVRRGIDAETKNSRLDGICSVAKQNDVTIFAIGFDVNDEGAAVMTKCASSDSHFYRVDDTDIEAAFASIANQINQLTLTQ